MNTQTGKKKEKKNQTETSGEKTKGVTVQKKYLSGGAKRDESKAACGLRRVRKDDTESVGKKDYYTKACTSMRNVAKEEIQARLQQRKVWSNDTYKRTTEDKLDK